MIGIGAANAFAGLFQGFPISTSGSRTAVAEQSGAKSQLTGVVGAALVAVDAPLPAEPAREPAAIGARGDRHRGSPLADGLRDRSPDSSRLRRSAFALSIIAALGVILFGVLDGIIIAVALSILIFFKRNWWPSGAVLGRVAALDSWHRIDVNPDAVPVRDVVVFRWEAPLFFANAGIFRQTIRQHVARLPASMGRCPVRGDHRHRRHGGRHARTPGQRAQPAW